MASAWTGPENSTARLCGFPPVERGRAGQGSGPKVCGVISQLASQSQIIQLHTLCELTHGLNIRVHSGFFGFNTHTHTRVRACMHTHTRKGGFPYSRCFDCTRTGHGLYFIEYNNSQTFGPAFSNSTRNTRPGRRTVYTEKDISRGKCTDGLGGKDGEGKGGAEAPSLPWG